MYIDFKKGADNFEIEHKICKFWQGNGLFSLKLIRSVMVGATSNYTVVFGTLK